jgi:hypothetical protein
VWRRGVAGSLAKEICRDCVQLDRRLGTIARMDVTTVTVFTISSHA